LWFIESLKLNNIKTYILYFRKLKVGYIRINIFKKNSVFISIIIKKKYRKSGFGSFYLNKVIKTIKKLDITEAYAEILKNNLSSKLFFISNDFKKIILKKKLKYFFNNNNHVYFKKI